MSKFFQGMTNVITAIFVILISIISIKTYAGPPPRIDVPSTFPGETIGNSRAGWIAPYVFYQRIEIKGFESYNRVTWFSKEGAIIKEVFGPRISANSYYILDRHEGYEVVFSVYDTLKIILPRFNPEQDAAIRGKDYGKYFFYDCLTDSGRYAYYYVDGTLRGTYGPYCVSWKKDFVMGENGCFVYAVPDSSTGNCKLISADSAGNEIFSVEPRESFNEITPSPSGNCIVVNTRSAYYTCFFASSDTTQVKIYPNGILGSWVPNTNSMIVFTSLGDEYTMHLLDWETGRFKWSIKNPLDYVPNHIFDGIAISEDYLILSGLAIRESIAHGPEIPNNLRGTIRMLAAINLREGKLTAVWYEPTFNGKWGINTYFPPMPNGGGRLIWYEGELYHITETNFSKIIFEDIKNFSNGWRSPKSMGQLKIRQRR